MHGTEGRDPERAWSQLSVPPCLSLSVPKLEQKYSPTFITGTSSESKWFKAVLLAQDSPPSTRHNLFILTQQNHSTLNTSEHAQVSGKERQPTTRSRSLQKHLINDFLNKGDKTPKALIPNKESHDRKTAHSTLKAVYTASNHKHADQERTFQNIFFRDP